MRLCVKWNVALRRWDFLAKEGLVFLLVLIVKDTMYVWKGQAPFPSS